MEPSKIYYVSIDKCEKRKDVWKSFPWPSPNLLSPIECLTGHERFFLNCYIQDFTYQSWRWDLIGPDTYEKILEKAKTYEFSP
jgi:hypothetical protein